MGDEEQEMGKLTHCGLRVPSNFISVRPRSKPHRYIIVELYSLVQ